MNYNFKVSKGVLLRPRKLGRASVIKYSATRKQLAKIKQGVGQNLTGNILVTRGSKAEKFFRSVNVRTDTRRGYGVVTSNRIPNAIANFNHRGQKWQTAHVLAYYFKTGKRPKKGDVVDHINSNIEDLRYGNLQEISNRDNLAKTLPARRQGGWKRAQRTIKISTGLTLQQLRKKTLLATRGSNALHNIAVKSEATKHRLGLTPKIAAKISATKTGSSKTISAAKKSWITRRQHFSAAQIKSQAVGGNLKAFSAKSRSNAKSQWATIPPKARSIRNKKAAAKRKR